MLPRMHLPPNQFGDAFLAVMHVCWQSRYFVCWQRAREPCPMQQAPEPQPCITVCKGAAAQYRSHMWQWHLARCDGQCGVAHQLPNGPNDHAYHCASACVARALCLQDCRAHAALCERPSFSTLDREQGAVRNRSPPQLRAPPLIDPTRCATQLPPTEQWTPARRGPKRCRGRRAGKVIQGQRILSAPPHTRLPSTGDPATRIARCTHRNVCSKAARALLQFGGCPLPVPLPHIRPDRATRVPRAAVATRATSMPGSSCKKAEISSPPESHCGMKTHVLSLRPRPEIRDQRRSGNIGTGNWARMQPSAAAKPSAFLSCEAICSRPTSRPATRKRGSSHGATTARHLAMSWCKVPNRVAWRRHPIDDLRFRYRLARC